MEHNSTGELGDSLMFDFDFDEEVPLIDNAHSQAHPSQQNETEVDLSNGKLGSLSASNLPVSMTTQKLNGVSGHAKNTEDLNSCRENASSLAPPKAPSATANPDTSPQAKRPTTESSELHPQAKENNELPLSDKMNTDSNLSGHENITQDATKTPLSGAPQPYVSTIHGQTGNSAPHLQPSNSVEHVDGGSSSGSNQSLQNCANSSQNLLESTFPGFGGTDPSHGNDTYVQPSKSTFFHSPLSGTSPQQSSPVTAEMIPNIGVIPLFNSEHEINLNGAGNGLQNEQPQQGMSPVNMSSTLSADQLAQNQPAIPYPTSFPQTPTGLGTVNPHLPPWLSDLNAPYMHFTPPRPQISQFQAPNIFDPECATPMLHASSVRLRSQYSSHQLFNLVPESVLFNPYPPALIRPQHRLNQSNQFPNSMLPVPPMPLGLRSPEFFQHNQAAVTPDHVSNLQCFNSLQTGVTFPPMIPEFNDRNRTMPSGPQTFQELLNQASRPSMACPTPGISQLNPVLSSSTHQHIGGNNATPFPQLELSLGNRNEQTHVGRRRGRRTSRYELRDSLSTAKRSKISKFTYEKGSTSRSEENEVNNPYASTLFNSSRPLKNTIYDPIFESIGLPVDPHLRLFDASN